MSAPPGRPQRPHFTTRVRPNLHWQEHAACNDSNPRIFFDPTRYAQALLVCAPCPVKEACRQNRNGAEGVWGGRAYGRPPGRPKRVNV